MQGTRSAPPNTLSWRGAQGGILQIISTTTGEQLAACKLHSFPQFDAMSVAEGRLFTSLENGTVSCNAEK